MTPRWVDFDPQDPLIRALRALPDARAPRTLAPRVMAAVHARMARPAPRTWFDWSLAWRVGSVAGAVAALVATVLVWPHVVAWAQPAVQAVRTRTAGVADRAGVVLNVAGVLFHAVWYPFVQPFLIFVTVMTITCATLGALVSRVALGGASR
jgi:hypothetical protein